MPGTNFSNKDGTGSVNADGFNATAGSSSSIPNLSTSGFGGQAPQLVASAGLTQGSATQIVSGVAIVVTVSLSTRGVKLPAAVTGRRVEIYSGAALNVKVYPGVSDKIGTAATNASVALVANKANIYRAQDAKTWRVLVGA
jgi:hypothetical protein